MDNLSYGVLFSTAAPISVLEDWLSSNCKGDYNIRLDGIDEERNRKRLQIYFEKQEDKLAFKQAHTHQPRRVG